MHSQNKRYYIPGDAIVYGTMNNNKVNSEGKNIRIFGHGTLSGDKLPHPNYAEPPIADNEYFIYHPIDIDSKHLNQIEIIAVLTLSFRYRCSKHSSGGNHNC